MPFDLDSLIKGEHDQTEGIAHIYSSGLLKTKEFSIYNYLGESTDKKIQKTLRRRKLESTKFEVYQGAYRKFDLSQTAKTSGVANCISVLVLAEDCYWLGHFDSGSLNPLSIEAPFTKMMKEIYDSKYDKNTLKTWIVGGTTFTEKSYPTSAQDEKLKEITERINKRTIEDIEHVDRITGFVIPRKLSLFYKNMLDEIEEILKKVDLSSSNHIKTDINANCHFQNLKAEKSKSVNIDTDDLKIEWLEPDTFADIGYCEDSEGKYKIIIDKKEYPQIIDPQQIRMIKMD